jgi:hypothetical protein
MSTEKKRNLIKRSIRKAPKSPRDAGKEKAEEMRSIGRGCTYIYRSTHGGMAL